MFGISASSFVWYVNLWEVSFIEGEHMAHSFEVTDPMVRGSPFQERICEMKMSGTRLSKFALKIYCV